MRNISSLRLVLFCLVASIACQSSVVSAQTRQNRQARLTPHQFSVAFWNYLSRIDQNDYLEWKSLPGKKVEISEAGENPHGDYMMVYANKQAVSDPLDLPYNSIIVAENYEEDKESLRSITVMYRARNYNPERNDWYWVKYKPNGDVAFRIFERERKYSAGRVGYCISCHHKAKGGDYVFANDDLTEEKLKKIRAEAAKETK